MSITSGAYTIAASGGDYTTIAAAIDDVGTLTGDLTLTITSALTETAQAAIDFNLGGYKFRLTSDEDHLGVFEEGNLISLNYATASGGWILCKPTGGGTVEIDHLDVKQITNSASGGRMMREFGGSTAYTLRMYHNLFNGDGKVLNGYGWDFADADGTKEIFANIVRGMNIACYISSADQAGEFANNTFIGGVYSTWFDKQITSGNGFRNNVSYGGTAYQGTHTSTPGLNNAGNGTTGQDSSWSSGADNIVSLVNSAFQSVTVGDGDTYLKPAVAGALDETNTTIGISGFTQLINHQPINCVGAKGLVGSGNPNYYYAMNAKRRSW